MKVLVTGSAGFIGSYVAKRYVERGDQVIGIDNLNDYYDVNLKLARLKNAGIDPTQAEKWNSPTTSSLYGEDYKFIRMDIEHSEEVSRLFNNEHFDIVIHLAAQAGVRYSITNPATYIKSNIDSFLNILEGCRNNNVKHLVYASSSSVYGLNGKVPFSEKDSVAHPVSLYAASKKSNELMAHTYSHLFNIPTTGLRFFTVYGPWGRPDMSPHLFMEAILNDKPLKVFNKGDMLRDFTYIDDIVEGVVRITDIIPTANPNWNNKIADPSSSSAPYKIYNIGNSNPVRLLDYINSIERAAHKKAKKEYLPMQPGDVYQTFADTTALAAATGFKPHTPLQAGIDKTLAWFRSFYNL